MKQLLVRVSLVAALAAGYTGAVVVNQASATKPNPEHKVTLCHRTHAETNPYVVINVDVASVKFEGHDSHDGPVWYPGAKADGVFWGDIIPSFTTEDGYPFNYPGKNLTAEGTAFLENDCQATTETTSTPPPTTTTPPPTTTTPPPTTTTPPPTTTTPPPTNHTSTPPESPRGVPPHHKAPRPSPTAFTGSDATVPGVAAGVLALVGLAALFAVRRKGAGL